MPEITDRADELLTPEERRIVAGIRAATPPEGMSAVGSLQARCERLELQIREVFAALCELIAEDTPESEMPSPTGLTELLAKAIPNVDDRPLPECWQRVLLDYRARQDTAIELARVTDQRDRALRVVAAVQDFFPLWDAYVERPEWEIDEETLDAIGRIREAAGIPYPGEEEPHA